MRSACATFKCSTLPCSRCIVRRLASGSEAKLLGRKCFTCGVFPLTDQVCFSSEVMHDWSVYGYSFVMVRHRYSSAFSKVKNIFTTVAANERDPITAAEAILDHMQLHHWRSMSQTTQCNASIVHSILRAPRGDGKEALVLASLVHGEYLCRHNSVHLLLALHINCKFLATWSMLTQAALGKTQSNTSTGSLCLGTKQGQAGDVAAVQVAISVLQFLQEVPWLAKDIVWVLIDTSCATLHPTKVRRCCARCVKGDLRGTAVSAMIEHAFQPMASSICASDLHEGQHVWPCQLLALLGCCHASMVLSLKSIAMLIQYSLACHRHGWMPTMGRLLAAQLLADLACCNKHWSWK